jgi:hypothetical protein
MLTVAIERADIQAEAIECSQTHALDTPTSRLFATCVANLGDSAGND